MVSEKVEENKDLKRSQILTRINDELPQGQKIQKGTAKEKLVLKTISNQLYNQKQKAVPAPILTIEDFESEVIKMFPTYLEEAEIDEPCMIDYKVGSNTPNDQFVGVFTTPAMLENVMIQKQILGKSFLVGDTTYKLVQGDKFLVSPVITQDITRGVRPVCFIISQHENSEAWEFGLTVLKQALDIFNKQYFPDEDEFNCDYFIADGGRAILNGRRAA